MTTGAGPDPWGSASYTTIRRAERLRAGLLSPTNRWGEVRLGGGLAVGQQAAVGGELVRASRPRPRCARPRSSGWSRSTTSRRSCRCCATAQSQLAASHCSGRSDSARQQPVSPIPTIGLSAPWYSRKSRIRVSRMSKPSPLAVLVEVDAEERHPLDHGLGRELLGPAVAVVGVELPVADDRRERHVLRGRSRHPSRRTGGRTPRPTAAGRRPRCAARGGTSR